MYVGVLITESIEPGAIVTTPFAVTRVTRLRIDDPAESEPVWTLLDVQVAPADVDELVAELSAALGPEGWYADLRSDDETIVVYPGRVFQYPRGDADGRREAVAYGRALGIPDAQLDWPV